MTPIDGGGHARLRSRRLASGIATSVASRGIAALAPLALIPITLSYLGPELYGLWMAVVALTSMMLWADLGLGNGLMTKLAPCQATGDWATARSLVSTTYTLVTGIAFALVAIVWVMSPLVHWPDILNVNNAELAPDARAIMLICLTSFLINVPLAIVHRVQYAYQLTVRSNLWQATGSVLSVVLALAAVRAELPKLVVVAAAVIGPLLVNILNSISLYGWRLARLAPRRYANDGRIARSLLSLGSQFLGLSILTAIALNIDNLIIARALGLSAVTDYSVPSRLFASLGLLVTLINLPLWGASGEALVREDVRWIRAMTHRLTVLSAIAVIVPGIVLVAIGSQLLRAWLGTSLDISTWLLVGLACGWLPLAIAAPMFMVQNAAGILRPQLAGWACFLALSLPAKWIAAQQAGIEGVAWAGAAVYLATVGPAAIVGYRSSLAQYSSKKSLEKGMT